MTLWMRPPELERSSLRDPLDPVAEGARHRLSREVSLAIWASLDEVMADASKPGDDERLDWFHAIAARIAARGGRLKHDVGRLTRVATEISGQRHASGRLARRPRPGAETRVEAEARAPRGDEATGWDPGERALPARPAIYRDIVGDGSVAPDAVALVDIARSGSSEGLDPAIRDQLAALLGRDLSDVRVHRGDAADAATRALGARAFTIGLDIVFGHGQYDPSSRAGARLIAHEVAHTQQDTSGVSTELRVSAPGDETEQEAERLAERFVALIAGAPFTAHTAAPPSEQRLREASVAPRSTPETTHASRVPAEPRAQLVASRAAAVSRQEHPGHGVAAPSAIPPGGTQVDEIGIVAWDEAPPLRLRASPAIGDANVIGSLPFNTRVHVIKRFPGDWLFVALADGRLGYVAAQYVWLGPSHPLPEPNARLHRVEPGAAGTAIAIAERYFRAAATDWGRDLRFYVNVLATVNHISVPSSVDGWQSVRFESGQFIWIPSVAFARSLHVSSGSYTYEAADALGIAGALQRIGQLQADFRLAITLSGQYIPAAVVAHVESAIIEIMQGLALLAVGAIALLAGLTLIGGLIGSAPGAAAGFELGLAIIEWVGLGFLVQWIASSVASIGGAFLQFLTTVWNARGDRAAIDLAARQFADAIGVLMGVLVQLLVMWAVSIGVRAALARLQGTAFARAFGETRLGQWLTERIARYNAGETSVPGPREVALRAQARALASELGLGDAQALALLRAIDATTLRALHDRFGSERLGELSSRAPSILDAFSRALRATGDDAAGRASLMEGARLNARGTLSNAVFEQALNAYTEFRGRYGGRVSGDFMSRFWRRLGLDTRQAAAEITLAEDLLAGRTPLGETSHVDALPESASGERVPEYRATTPDGARLVENKAIGRPDQPLSRNGVRDNAGSANGQLRAQSEATGETGGLIRLDGRDAGPSPDVTPETLADWVSSRLPSPRDSMVARWVEIFYRNGTRQLIRVVLELENQRFVLRSSEVVR